MAIVIHYLKTAESQVKQEDEESEGPISLLCN